MIEIKNIRKQDYKKAQQFAIQGMHLDWYMENCVILNLYAKYFWGMELNRATKAYGAYVGDQFVGVLLADMKGEEKKYYNRWRALYVKIFYVAVDGVFAGFLALSDTLRKESAATIAALSDLGVQPVLLTGDHENAAKAIADKLHIHEVRFNCLPEDKLKYIEEYQNQGMPVCMIGDGVNDAPVLKKADIGIAMGGVGSDIAVDAADIALVDDEVKELPHLIALSKRMMTTIKLNMTFSMTLNFIAITLAIIGTLNPVVGALVHNAGSVLVITNSAFLLKWRKK